MGEPVLHLGSVHFDGGERIWGLGSHDYRRLETGFKRLSRRSLLMAGPGDTVIIDRPVDGEYISRLRALGAGGLSHIAAPDRGGSCLCDDAAASPQIIGLLREWSGGVELYMPSSAEERLSEKIGRSLTQTPSRVAALLNDKVFFQRLLEDIGAPVIKTFIGNSDAVAQRLRKSAGEPVIVRGSGSVGGSRVWAAKDENGRRAAIRDMDRAGRDSLYLLAPLIDFEFSPNLQFHVDSQAVRLIGETMQVMNGGLGHTGNLFDRASDEKVRAELLRLGSALALEAASLGWRGVMGVDFIVTSGGEVYPVEMNARHNTSTHALWLFNRFVNGDPFEMAPGGRAAFMRYCARAELSAMEWIGLLGADALDPDTGRGILPYDLGGAELSALIAGRDEEDRARLMEKAESLAASCPDVVRGRLSA